MKCPKCQHENTAKARFCEECATPLTRSCGNCGSQVSATARFCLQCGHPLKAVEEDPRFASPKNYTPQHIADKILVSRAALEGERKLITVLFADIKGSMEVIADRDPEEVQKLLHAVLERMIEAVHRYEGTVNTVMGDGLMALFGAPLAHEDHAVRACYAALRMQDNIARFSDEIQRSYGVPVMIRIGVNSGEIVISGIGNDLHMDYTVVGQTAHLAARMEQMAKPGSVLTTADTFRLVEGYLAVKPLGALPVKGLAHPVDVYEVTGAGAARSRLQAAAGPRLDAFRRPHRRIAAPAPRPATRRARPRPGGGDRRPGRRRQVAPGARVHSFAAYRRVAGPGIQLDVIRTCHAVFADNRAAAALLQAQCP